MPASKDRVLVERPLGWLFFAVGSPFTAMAGYYIVFPSQGMKVLWLYPLFIASALILLVGLRVVLLGPIRASHLRATWNRRAR